MFVSMQVEGRQPEGPVREHLERRLRGAVAAYGGRARGVALRSTASPPRGRVHCRVAISLDAGVYTGAARGANVFFAAEEAIARAVRNADRAVRAEAGVAAGLFLAPSASHG